jgi:hypothetical protein
MLRLSAYLWPFKAVFSFGNSQKTHRSKFGIYGGWSTLLLIFMPKTPIQRTHHEQRHYYDARSKHQAKVHVSSDEQLHITSPVSPSTMLVHCLTFFKKLPMKNAFVINKKSAMSLLGLVYPTLLKPIASQRHLSAA